MSHIDIALSRQGVLEPGIAVRYRTVNVSDVQIAYCESGLADSPALLRLHGFPIARHMFRDLILHLTDRFHLVASDLPDFGQSDMPSRYSFRYMFNNLAHVIDHFTELIGLSRLVLYTFDYGASVGWNSLREY
jgi:pimeloyl-ACP methyl ester carboxylesterase